MAEHYQALFGWLAWRAGVTDWVERSGSSLDYAGDLLRVFPDACIVHLVRDGREVALSMRNHAAYRMAVQLLYGVMPEGVDPNDADAVVDGWLSGDPPVELFGRYWSDQVAVGLPVLAALPAEHLLTLEFEDVVADPARHIEAAASFFGLRSDPDFAARASELVGAVPPLRVGSLEPDERNRLEQACARGFDLLREQLIPATRPRPA